MTADERKTLLAAEFLIRGATQFEEPGVFITFEETGEELEDVHFAELLEDAARAIDYHEPLPAPSAPASAASRSTTSWSRPHATGSTS